MMACSDVQKEEKRDVKPCPRGFKVVRHAMRTSEKLESRRATEI